jgi:hypothetical protein
MGGESWERVEAKASLAYQNGRSAGHLHPLFPLSSPLTSSLAEPPPLWCIMEEQWPHGLADRPPLGAPIKGACQGEPPLSCHKLTSKAKVSESFYKF